LMLPSVKEEKAEDENKASDSGWLVKVRTHQYLQNANNSHPSKTRSVGDLRSQDPFGWGNPNRFVDELSWQVKKEFHLSKYIERRRSSFVSESEHHDRRSQQEIESHRLSAPLSSQTVWQPASVSSWKY